MLMGDVGVANVTFITLIAKKDGALDVGVFVPINLFNGLCKIVVKCLVERLKLLMDGLIGSHQIAFVHDH